MKVKKIKYTFSTDKNNPCVLKQNQSAIFIFTKNWWPWKNTKFIKKHILGINPNLLSNNLLSNNFMSMYVFQMYIISNYINYDSVITNYYSI